MNDKYIYKIIIKDGKILVYKTLVTARIRDELLICKEKKDE